MTDDMPPAGPELDALIAEQVMDCAVFRSEVDVPDGWQYLPGEARWPMYGNGTFCFSVPAYSTEMTAAWIIVEHLRARQIDVMLFQGEPQPGRGPADQWECALWWHEHGEHRETTQYAETALLAICRAALCV